MEVGCEKTHRRRNYTEFTFLGTRGGTEDAYDVSSLEMLVYRYKSI